jgi:phospholipid transport system substrate-binding protein
LATRRALIGACAFLLPAVAAAARAADAGPAMAHIQRLLVEGQRVAPGSGSEAALGRLLDRDFDVPLIARDALGPAFQRMSEAERGEYLALFREHVILSVVRQVVLSPVQDVVIIEARDLSGPDALIGTRVVDSQGRVRLANWRVRLEGGAPRIVDVVVDGVSLAQTRADELRSVLQRNGGEAAALIAALRAQNAQMRRP